jgi:hypothetical protein
VKYYLGPWQLGSNPTAWTPPPGTVGLVDLATPSQCAEPSDPTKRGLGFFATPNTLDSSYTILGNGDLRSINARLADRSAWKTLLGYIPQGTTIMDCLWDHLTNGADATGAATCFPLVPNADGWMDLHLGGHGRLQGERLEWGKPGSRGTDHTPKIRLMLRAQFRLLWQANQTFARKWLDMQCIKFAIADWKELVPLDLQASVPGRLPHSTTITDDFTRADGTTIGNLLSWTEVQGDFQTVSNQVKLNLYDGTYCFARAESDLSSADHYAQYAFTSGGGDVQMGPVVRFAGAALTAYLMLARPSDSIFYTYKIVAGSFTQLQTTTLAISDATYKTQANGSTISIFKNGANQTDVTDTSITGNTRTGIMLRAPSATGNTVDDFQAADLGGGGGGIIYTQLERDIRGYARGIFSGTR